MTEKRAGQEGHLRQDTRAKGRSGEDAAVQYLVARGYTILERNYFTRCGEIDIVARAPGGTTVFVEVKSGSGSRYGHPLFWVTRRKQTQILRMAQAYRRERPCDGQPCRMDVIAVCDGVIDHLENAFLAA